mmetsp:Transcript_9880/g.12396  ORF Transcript_9880/g.12396 Transcript_9880/m.12396 type:complete len:256 (+) Transcript_9880:103-870(+)
MLCRSEQSPSPLSKFRTFADPDGSMALCAQTESSGQAISGLKAIKKHNSFSKIKEFGISQNQRQTERVLPPVHITREVQSSMDYWSTRLELPSKKETYEQNYINRDTTKQPEENEEYQILQVSEEVKQSMNSWSKFLNDEGFKPERNNDIDSRLESVAPRQCCINDLLMANSQVDHLVTQASPFVATRRILDSEYPSYSTYIRRDRSNNSDTSRSPILFRRTLPDAPAFGREEKHDERLEDYPRRRISRRTYPNY